MRNYKKTFQVFGAFAALLTLAFAVSCKGFFQNPTLTGLTVGPSATITQGTTVQESATGTYSDGSTATVTTGVVWSSDTQSVATISNSGLVTGVGSGTATITGAVGTVSGTSSIMVDLGNVTAITISPTTANAIEDGGTASFQAFATVTGDTTPQDVTATALWTVTSTSSGTTADFSVSQGTDPLTVTVQSTATVGEVATITASYTSNTTTLTATAKLTVTQ